MSTPEEKREFHALAWLDRVDTWSDDEVRAEERRVERRSENALNAAIDAVYGALHVMALICDSAGGSVVTPYGTTRECVVAAVSHGQEPSLVALAMAIIERDLRCGVRMAV